SLPGFLMVICSCRSAGTRRLAQVIAQVVRKARMPQPPQRFFFKLADSFAAQPEFIRNFLKRMRFAAAQPEAQTQDMALARGEFAQHFFNRLLKKMLCRRLDGARRVLILNEITEFAVAVVTNWAFQRDGVLAGIHHAADGISRQIHFSSDFFRSGASS